MVLALLTVVWGIYGVSWFRHRSAERSANSIDSFSRQLDVLGRTNPSGVAAARPLAAPSARQRRRQALLGLMAAVPFTLVLAIAAGGAFVTLHLLADVALAGYVAFLVQVRRRAEEQRAKVVILPSTPTYAMSDEPRIAVGAGR